MSTAATPRPEAAPTSVENYRAAVVHRFHEPLKIERVPARVRRQRSSGRRRRGDSTAGWCQSGNRDRRVATRIRAGIRLAASWRDARARRSAGRERHEASDIRDCSGRRHARRIDRRHPHRPARGMRAARGRQDPSDPRNPSAGRDKRSHRKGNAGLSLIVFDSEDAANRAAERVSSGMPDVATIEDIEVREVVAHA